MLAAGPLFLTLAVKGLLDEVAFAALPNRQGHQP